ncbi:MAG TPA: hypothetical protein VKH63_02595 [Candidatus Acidoferrum sp.]|nr:hypothetical protein [Candidatus Acidoferrum sp.]
MSESTPHYLPVAVLLLLGTMFAVGASFLVLLYGLARRSKPVSRFGASVAASLIVGYLSVLCGVSLWGKEKALPLDGWKYFCEVNRHIAYSVSGVSQAGVILGPGGERTLAQGQGYFVVVNVNTWIDEKTTSQHRGNSPLTPGERAITLIDDSGHRYRRTSAGESAFASAVGFSTPFGQPLRPGESYTTRMVFEIPRNSEPRCLLIADPDKDWMDRLLIGHENSFLHKKIYLDFHPSSIEAE